MRKRLINTCMVDVYISISGLCVMCERVHDCGDHHVPFNIGIVFSCGEISFVACVASCVSMFWCSREEFLM